MGKNRKDGLFGLALLGIGGYLAYRYATTHKHADTSLSGGAIQTASNDTHLPLPVVQSQAAFAEVAAARTAAVSTQSQLGTYGVPGTTITYHPGFTWNYGVPLPYPVTAADGQQGVRELAFQTQDRAQKFLNYLLTGGNFMAVPTGVGGYTASGF